jgi:DNA gyrase subunit A
MSEKLIFTPIEDEMKMSYIDYAMSVIVGRALPDVRDGLKPVHRRILYAMYEGGLLPGRPYKKSATVIGDVLGKYHPHGDMAVYDALVRMAQNFSLRYPLIDGQGNFGSIDGDPPAAYRYTEARLSPIALEMLKDIDKNTVDFVPNFDGRLKEPTVLPALLPNLILNGSTGIAVGMSTNIPPHNLNEIVSALLYLIENPDAETEELFQFIKGPDFPTGGIIFGTKGIKECYIRGRGNFIVRAKYYIEEGVGRKKIVITEIPYMVNKSSLLEKIAFLVRDKKIDGIQDLRDESDREGLRIVIELKRGVSEKLVLNQLFKYTSLQDKFNVIMLALVDGEPKVLSLKEILSLYLNHREEVTKRKTNFLLKKAEHRAHILEGLKIALSNIDRVIEIIKKAQNPPIAKKSLIKEFKLTEVQAQAILDMKLQALTKLETSKIEEEYKNLIREIERLRSILANRNLLLEEIKKELLYLKEKYGDERRTEIIEQEVEEIEYEELIKKEKLLVLLTRKGYIKRIPGAYLKTQTRGTQGQRGIVFDEDDMPHDVFYAFSHDTLIFISNKGRVFSLRAYELPESGLRGKGKPINLILSLKENEKIVDIIALSESRKKEFLFFITRKGKVKKTDINSFRNAGKRGIIGQNLPPDDETVDALLVEDKEDVIILKENGLGIRINAGAIRNMGRNAYGVAGINVSDAKCVAATKIVGDAPLCIVTEKGFGKRFKSSSIRRTGRGGKGVILQKVNEKTGKAIWIKHLEKNSHLVLLTEKGKLLRQKADNISLLSRSAMGVRIIKFKGEDRVIGCARIPAEV